MIGGLQIILGSVGIWKWPGNNQCAAFKWLHENGGIESRFEMQTVVTTNQEAVYEAIQKVKAMRSIRREAHES